ncbi:class I SAM-dependent methyltransferase [Vibrio lentus]|nr:class I SAM-dependent methyltransferase [Vibrio lentus]
MGCKVQMVSDISWLHYWTTACRKHKDPDIGGWVSERMKLIHASSHDALDKLSSDPNFEQPDVVYLDPMYRILRIKEIGFG